MLIVFIFSIFFFMDLVYALASDTTFDGKVKFNDIAKLYQYLKGKIDKLD